MRIIIVSLVFLLASMSAHASQPRVIGVVLYAKQLTPAFEGLREGMAAAGYEEGVDVEYIVRTIDGDLARIPGVVAEFAAEHVAFIFTTTSNVATFVKELTGENRIPVLFNEVADPVEIGLVNSLEAPGRNITGVSHIANRLLPKRLAVLKDCFPGVERVGIFMDPSEAYVAERIDLLLPVAEDLGITLEVLNFSNRRELERMITGMAPGDVDAIFVSPSPAVTRHIDLLVEASRRLRIPLMVHDNAVLARGGAIGYSPSFFMVGKQSGIIADMILRGIDPGVIPVQFPNDVSLVLNGREIATYDLPAAEECLYYASDVMK